MVHLVYSVQALLLSDYFKGEFESFERDKSKENIEPKANTKDDIILMMNSYSCPKEIASKVKAVYTLKNKEELENKLFELTTQGNIPLRSWY